MTQCNDAIAAALSVAEEWYESNRNSKGGINTNVMTSGMAVAELLRGGFPLTAESIKSNKESQVKGLSGALIKRILANNGETRKFTSEGGRTSRGTLKLATSLALLLSQTLERFSPDEDDRNEIADSLQSYFVNCVQWDYFNKRRLEVAIDPDKPVSGIVADIFAAVKVRPDQPSGAVAQHLVGAKLELRFPALEIGRDQANAADLQTDRQGDFQIGNTAFHVTMAPSAKLVDRIKDNVAQGFRSVVLVPETEVSFAMGLFKSEWLSNYVGVQSIESFVGTNIEEMGGYRTEGIKLCIAHFLRRYNDRIQACESDQSLRISEPGWVMAMLDSQISYATVEA